MPILIELDRQRLTLSDDQGHVLSRYPISSAERGAGEQRDSYQTPRGRHIIRAKIGAHAPRAAVFVGRRWTGECCTAEAWAAQPQRDWILSRILWLSGCEPGRNRLGEVDTMRRYIYIHGTPDAVALGVPGSHGCIRMHNDDVIALFDQVYPGMPVNIVEQGEEPT